MKRYLEQLISDIRKATLQVRPPHPLWLESEADPDNELELEDMSYVEKYLYGEEEPISQITGISAGQLPTPEKLSLEQQALLATELEKLLQYFHFYLDFPENFPAHLRYPFIRDFWNEEHVALSFGENHIEFCDFEESQCPFPGYCSTCKEIETELKFDEECESGKNFDFDVDVENLLPSPEQLEKWAKENGMDCGDESGLNDILHSSDDFALSSDLIGGFFNDEGTTIDPVDVPVPGLCVICKKYHDEDPEENFLCMLYRSGQHGDADFECGAFEKI